MCQDHSHPHNLVTKDLDVKDFRPSLKIAHLSDLHLGRPMYGKVGSNGFNIRELDAELIAQQIVAECIEHNVDLLLIAGDTFDKPQPNIRSIVFAQEILRRLSKSGIKVVILAGNHDTDDIKTNVAVSKVLDDRDREIYSYVEPYVRQEVFPGVFLHVVSHHAFSQQIDTLLEIKPVDGAVNILTTHGSCVDPILEMKLTTEQSPREVVIPDFLLNDFEWDAVLLGHIHERGYVGHLSNTLVYYNGSSYRRGFSDGVSDLGIGWTMWDIDMTGKLFKPTYMSIAQRPQFDLPAIDARGLSSVELTEAIVNNLEKTQMNGTTFDERIAPIVRQKVVGITSSQNAGLDNREITKQSAHTLSYQFVPEFSAVTPSNKDSSPQADSIEKPSTANLSDVFDVWSDNSVTLSQLDSSIRGKVEKQTKEFIELGRNSILERES